MSETAYKTALIVGVGSGLSASLARVFAGAGLKVALAARRAANLAPLAQQTGAKVYVCDAT
ncbi:MAG: SDR family NAD(P)-dependent oxidoreductase, partial [Xanthobacteraceae bacterium]